MRTYIIKDWAGNQVYKEKFNSYDDAWSYLYNEFPVTYNDDGTQDDREEELGEFWVEQI